MRYLSGQGVTYSGGVQLSKQPLEISTWTDADCGGDLDDRKSTSGYVVKINQCSVGQPRNNQPFSTAEAEYMGIGFS